MNLAKIRDHFLRLEQILAKLQQLVIVLTSIIIVLAITIQVFLRVVLTSPLFGIEEIALIGGMWLYLVGASYCARDRSDCRASILHLVFKNQRIVEFARSIAALIAVFIGGLMITWTYDYFQWGLTHKSIIPNLGVNYIVPQSALFFGAILMTFYVLLELIDHVVLAITGKSEIAFTKEE